MKDVNDNVTRELPLREMGKLVVVPPSFKYDDRMWTTLETMENVYSRALALPHNGGAPKWFSNKELFNILNNQ